MRTNFEELLEAGVHFGHLKSKWNPNMAPYIFTEKNGIHVIDLNKTVKKIETAAAALKQIAKSGKKIMFVATKKQAKDILTKHMEEINMPYITERWLGGMMTNFATVKKSIRKMQQYDKMLASGTINTMSKRERLQRARQRTKLQTIFGSISEMNRIPAAMFIVDIKNENIAFLEAKKLGIPVFAMVDTNSNPDGVDFIIPSNDDATKSIDKIIGIMAQAIKEGLADRSASRDKKEKTAKA